MNWNKKSIIFLGLFALLLCAFFCACEEKTKSDKELASQAVEDFLVSLKNHNIELTNALLSGNEYIDPDDEELLRAAYYTIDDCYLESIDFPESDNLDYFVAVVHYVIVYSDDYIPIGSRQQGKNEIEERFTLEKRDGKYVIISVSPVFYG